MSFGTRRMCVKNRRLWESIFVFYYSNILRIELNQDLIFIKVIAPIKDLVVLEAEELENSQINIHKTSELYIGYKLV